MAGPDHARAPARARTRTDQLGRLANPVTHGDARYAYARYYFTNRSEDIKDILCQHLDLLGIAWRRVGDRHISIARREAVAALDAFVGPKR